MKILSALQQPRPWLGLIGGAIAWYLAHDISFYYSHTNCDHRYIVPTVHVLALMVSLYCGLLSYRSFPSPSTAGFENRPAFFSGIGTAAAGLFSLVIAWQGLAALFFTGCER